MLKKNVAVAEGASVVMERSKAVERSGGALYIHAKKASDAFILIFTVP